MRRGGKGAAQHCSPVGGDRTGGEEGADVAVRLAWRWLKFSCRCFFALSLVACIVVWRFCAPLRAAEKFRPYSGNRG